MERYKPENLRKFRNDEIAVSLLEDTNDGDEQEKVFALPEASPGEMQSPLAQKRMEEEHELKIYEQNLTEELRVFRLNELR